MCIDMRTRSFESVVRRKVVVAVAPVVALVLASSVAVTLTFGGFAALGATLSLGASWLAIVYRDEIFRRGDRAGNYVTGLRSERFVQQELAALERRHFVRHDVSLPFGGNIDHVVCGPTGAFAIETKTRRYVKVDLPLARRRALWLSKRLEGHWVTPVICLVDSDRRPFQHDRVWVVGVVELREWLEARRDRPVDPVFALGAL
jgi:hypothetical protein